MSEIVLGRGVVFPSPFTDWYRERSFRIAFAVSLLIHASLLALIPALRSVRIEPPQVMSVELITPEESQVLQPVQPVPRTVERPPEPVPEPEVIPPPPVTTPPPPQRAIEETLLRPEPRVEPRPEPVIRQPEPQAPAQPPTEVVRPLPRPEPRPEPIVVQRPEPRPEPRVEPRTEIRPEPQVVPRVEPVPVPPPVVAQPRVEPVIERPAPPPPVAAVRPPPVAAPAPPPVVAPPVPAAPAQPARSAENEDRLKLVYGQSISQEIRRYQKYPPVAARRGWEGTAEVLLKISADGRVAGITLGKSSGRPVLDEEALAMVRRATPLPQAPEDLRGRELTVTVPIVFRLRES